MPPKNFTKIIITTCLFIFLLFGIIFIYKSKKNTPGEEIVLNKELATNLITDNLSLDSDGDGLRDWEEFLWKTDPDNQDSNSDGIFDGAEIERSREIVFQEQVNFQKTKKPQSYPSTTETIKTKKPIISINQQKSQDSENELKIYGNTIGKILKNRAIDLPQELDFFSKLGAEMSVEDFEKLQKSGEKYRDTSVSLDLVNVPEKAIDLHKELTNAYTNIATAIFNMTSFKNEGVIPKQSVLSYNETALAIGNKIFPFIDFFKKNNISFSSNESGSIFVNPFN